MKSILVIDFEATCFENESFEQKNFRDIIQIGLVEVNIESLEITREYSQYVKPKRHDISEFCTKLTGITKKNVYKQGIELESLISILENKFGIRNKLVVAWGRDDKFMEFDQYLNLGQLYSILKRTNKKINLEKALLKEGLFFEGNAHDALVDARNTAKIFIDIVKKYDIIS